MHAILARLSATSAKAGVGTIVKDTPIMPAVVADNVVGKWLNAIEDRYPDIAARAQKVSDQLADYLAAEAERLYKVNPNFRKHIQASGNKGRDMLISFMFHWMTARMCKSFPVIKLRDVPRAVTGLSPDM